MFGCTIQTVYGASDGGVPVMTRVGDPPEKRWTTVGRTLPATELRIAAPDMAELPPGEVGEVLWRNPTKTFGYLNDAERTDCDVLGRRLLPLGRPRRRRRGRVPAHRRVGPRT